MSLSPRIDEFEPDSDDDAIFVPIADLFSLLSLTVIYVVLTFGQTVPFLTAVENVVAASFQGSGPGKPIDPRDVYITLHGDPGKVTFYLTRGGSNVSTAVTKTEAATQIPEKWLVETIQRGGSPPVIFIYLARSDDLVVKSLFTDLQRFLGEKYPQVQVAF